MLLHGRALGRKLIELLAAPLSGDLAERLQRFLRDPCELPGFLGWNRGKRSIAVDLKTADGRTIVERLATRGDVVMENMRPGVAERLGLGDAALRALNPRLIYCALELWRSTSDFCWSPSNPEPANSASRFWCSPTLKPRPASVFCRASCNSATAS